MRSEFDTLEQYQESMKEFNENTRMGFEEFIQFHGSDRNKLQLRCTPYTSKKGGYGSFDLDFGLCVYQHQQTKVDELKLQVAEMKSRLNDAYTAGQSAMYAARQSKVDELQEKLDASEKTRSTLYEENVDLRAKNDDLQKRVNALTLALDQIAYPIPHMQKEAELNGCELNGYWAVKMSEDHTYSKDIARRALEKEQALKGDQ